MVLAHRGLVAADRPENTSAAVEAALLAGADGVEVDVRLSADGVLVGCHDPDLQRLARRPEQVAATTWSELAAVPLAGEHRLATLDDLLDAAGGGRVVVEVKQPPVLAGPALRTALAVVGLLRSRGRRAAEDVVVSSSSPEVLEALQAAGAGARGIRTALVGRPDAPLAALLPVVARLRCAELHPHVSQALGAPHLVRRAATAGTRVVPWTVDDPVQATRLRTAGAAGVISDLPTQVRVSPAAAAGVASAS